MEGKTLSLSKKLDGGYLHVKKSVTKEPVKNVTKGGYSNYLNRLQGGSECKKVSSGDGKVVAINLGGSKKKYKSPKKRKERKEGKEIKDEKNISLHNIIPKRKAPVKAPVIEPVKAPVKEPVKALVKELVQKPIGKPVPIVLPVTKGSLKKGKVVKRNRSPRKNRSNGRSLTRRRKHDLKKGKRISVTKTRTLSNKDVDKIQSKLKLIKGKSTDEIKQELDKQGIQLTGKSPEILKDIYMYSQLCGINIKRE